jgi:transcriptional regulator with XRE-family HTH domain
MLGEYIKYMRISRGITQKELAKKLYIAPCTLSHYETGIRMVPFSIFEKSLKIMDFKLSFIDCRTMNEIKQNDVDRILK